MALRRSHPFQPREFIRALEILGEAEIRERLEAGQYDQKFYVELIEQWLASKERERAARKDDQLGQPTADPSAVAKLVLAAIEEVAEKAKAAEPRPEPANTPQSR